ncbi:MAG: LysM peptidoglycan-binding domain-containing protein [Chloroflexi bacterium]|nr:LysM peptidoglycan-binding domain-containing protein [Chloroflexota bacterium]
MVHPKLRSVLKFLLIVALLISVAACRRSKDDSTASVSTPAAGRGVLGAVSSPTTTALVPGRLISGTVTIPTAAPAMSGTNTTIIIIPTFTPSSGQPAGQNTPLPEPSGGGTTVQYTVAPGDTLFSIARRFRVMAEEVARDNGIADLNKVVIGQALTIKNANPIPVSYTVQVGDTLISIASRHNTTVEALKAANAMTSDTVQVGQKLNLPLDAAGPPQPTAGASQGGSSGQTYVVQPGDTLLGIAVRYKTTTEALVAANNLQNENSIFVGQKLKIP